MLTFLIFVAWVESSVLTLDRFCFRWKLTYVLGEEIMRDDFIARILNGEENSKS